MKLSKSLIFLSIIAVLVLSSLLIPAVNQATPARAAVTWTKYSSEVTLDDQTYVVDASVIKDGSTYKMWYSHGETDLNALGILDALTLAIPDVVISKITALALLEFFGELDEVDVSELVDMLDGTSTVIGYATSTNGVDWTVQDSEVLAGTGAAWNSVGTPCVIKDDDTYRMWYTRVKTDLTQETLETILTDLGNEGDRKDAMLDLLDSISTVIGYATSTNGIAWTVQDSEVLAGNGDAWNSVSAPGVIMDSGTYKMWYTRVKTDLTQADLDALDSATFGVDELVDILDGTATVIGYATSSNGIAWTVQDSEVLAGDGYIWNSVASPSVVKGTSYEMWYTNGSTDLTTEDFQTLLEETAGLADDLWDIFDAFTEGDFETLLNEVADLDITTIKSLLSNTSTAVGYATSSNGITWTVQSSQHLAGSSTGAWSSVAAPSVVKDGDAYKMWYMEGIDNLSVANLLDLVLGTDLPIGYAYYTPTVVPTTPGGGGGDWTPAPTIEITTFGAKTSISVDSKGVVQKTFTAKSPDGKLTITIPKGTKALDKNGKPLTSLTANINTTPPSPPTGANIIGLVYDFGPAGATFAPPIIFEFTVSPDDIIPPLTVDDLVGAYYDETSTPPGWVDLPTSVVPGTTYVLQVSVSHFTNFAILTHAQPAAFTTSALTISPSEVNIGQSVTISAMVANTGGLSGSYEVTLKVDNIVVDAKYVTLAGGASQSVTFTTAKDAAGTYTAAVDGLSGTFTVKAPIVTPPPPPAPPAPIPAAFTTSALAISPAEVDVEQSVTISVLVTNTGELSGSYEVTLKVDNIVVDAKYVTLAGGASQTVTFVTAKDAAGTYTAAVDGLSGTFTVKAPTVPVKPGLNWWLIGGIIAVVIIALVVWLVLRRRRD